MRLHYALMVCGMTAMFVMSPSSQAEILTAKTQLIACASEAVLSEMRGYEADKDQKGVTKLMRTGQCKVIAAGESVTIVRPGILTATIEYRGSRLFTRADTIRR